VGRLSLAKSLSPRLFSDLTYRPKIEDLTELASPVDFAFVRWRQVLGAIAQFEKASAVAKFAAARKRKRAQLGNFVKRSCVYQLGALRPAIVEGIDHLNHAVIGTFGLRCLKLGWPIQCLATLGAVRPLIG
jgi:hypothetical protein